VSKSGDGLLVEERSRNEHVKVWVPIRAIYDTAWCVGIAVGSKIRIIRFHRGDPTKEALDSSASFVGPRSN